MAPSKTAAAAAGNKRQAVTEAKGQKAAKKPKVDPMLQAVLECVSASGLSESCTAMLTAMIPLSLGLPVEKRGALQIRAVAMAKEILDEQGQKLEAALEEQTKAVTTVEGSKAELSSNVEAAESQAKTAEEDVAAKKAVVAEKQQDVTDKEAALKAALTAQTEGDAAVTKAEAALENVKGVVANHVKPLCSTEGWVQSEAKKHCDEVLKLLKSFNCSVDESLSMSLPSCCSKAPAERGDFDRMALDEVEKTLQDKDTALTAEIEAGVAGKEERAKNVEEAQKAKEAALEAKKAASDALADSEVAKANAAESLKTAQAAVAKFEPELAAATAALDTAKEALKQFQEYTLACFETLEKKTTPAPAAPAAAATEQKVAPEQAATIEAGTLGA